MSLILFQILLKVPTTRQQILATVAKTCSMNVTTLVVAHSQILCTKGLRSPTTCHV